MKQGPNFKHVSDHEQIDFSTLMQAIPESGIQILNQQTPTLLIQNKLLSSNSKNQLKKSKSADQYKINIHCNIPSQHKSQQTNIQISDNQFASSLLHIIQAGGKQFVNSLQYTSKQKKQNQNKDQQVISKNNQTNIFLKDTIKKYKIKSIISNFVKKLKRVSILTQPIQYNIIDQFPVKNFWNQSGFQLPQVAQNIISFLNIIQITGICLISTLGLVYQQVNNNRFTNIFQIFAAIIAFLRIVIKLVTVKYHSGKKLHQLLDIWNFYANRELTLDILSAIITISTTIDDSYIFVFLQLITFLKIPECLQEVQTLQVYFVKNLYNQQYWSLIKILLFNFSFAHIISIVLTAMTRLNPTQNWMIKKNIDEGLWYEQYIWSYYWANTIMLTVGFGDFVATNYQEALCLIFIQTFSCLALAYNINCIGSILQRIRQQDAQKSKKFKIFKKLTDQNELPQDLCWRINNYIQQNAQLRKNFNYQQQREFIMSLPSSMKRQFLNKTLYNLAERIQMRVSHPQEIIQHVDDDFNLIILKGGRLGFNCKSPIFTVKDFIMDIKQVGQNDNPTLINLQFILRKRPLYEIKSMQYAIFFFLTYDKFIEILKQTEMDYEFYCALRDRIKNIPDQFQVFKCQLCEGKHLKALCPKLHYIPYYQNIVHKFLFKQKKLKNKRIKGERKQNNLYNSFQIYLKTLQQYNQNKSFHLFEQKTKKIKSKNDFSISLGSVRQTMQFSDSSVEVELKKIQQRYGNLTNQIIKDQINKLRKYNQEEDQIWSLKVDLLCDFNGYFNSDNPSNLCTKFNKYQKDWAEKIINAQNKNEKQGKSSNGIFKIRVSKLEKQYGK